MSAWYFCGEDKHFIRFEGGVDFSELIAVLTAVPELIGFLLKAILVGVACPLLSSMYTRCCPNYWTCKLAKQHQLIQLINVSYKICNSSVSKWWFWETAKKALCTFSLSLSHLLPQPSHSSCDMCCCHFDVAKYLLSIFPPTSPLLPFFLWHCHSLFVNFDVATNLFNLIGMVINFSVNSTVISCPISGVDYRSSWNLISVVILI